MNAPAKPLLEEPGPLLSEVSEMFWSLGVLAEIGQREAQLGDLAAVNYATRRAVALVRHLTATAADLTELAQCQPRERARAEKVYTDQEPAR